MCVYSGIVYLCRDSVSQGKKKNTESIFYLPIPPDLFLFELSSYPVCNYRTDSPTVPSFLCLGMFLEITNYIVKSIPVESERSEVESSVDWFLSTYLGRH